MDKNLRSYLVELIGTFAVVLVSAGAVCADQYAALSGQGGLRPGSVGIALAYGLIYAAALAAALPYSNGYLNPAITLMLWVFKRLDGGRTVGLIAVQLLGAALAGMVLYFAFNEQVLTAAHLGAPYVKFQAFGDVADTRWLVIAAVAIEAAITFILAFLVYGTAIDPRFHRLPGVWGKRLVGLWIGLATVAITLFAFPVTGAAANPARWFGPAVWETAVPALKALAFADKGIPYWFGPTAGALLAGVLYNMLILPAESEPVPAAPVAGHRAAASATLFRARK
jgi:glycerol uptake facilitator-like aquaporin